MSALPSDHVSVTVNAVTTSDMLLPVWMAPYAQQLFGIPTHMTVAERFLLVQAALSLPARSSVVEIGSYLGASTAFLGFAASVRDGIVHAVDPWTNDAMGAEGRRDTFAEFEENTRAFAPYVVAHQGYSADVHAREGAILCDMLFIDGDHSYDAVVTDLRLWLPSLKRGGLLAMHDIDAPEVRRAYDDVVGAQIAGPPQVTDRLLVCNPLPSLTAPA